MRARTRSLAIVSATSSSRAGSAISTMGVAGVPSTSSPGRRKTFSSVPASGLVTVVRPTCRSARRAVAWASSREARAAAARACASSTSWRAAMPRSKTRWTRTAVASAFWASAAVRASEARAALASSDSGPASRRATICPARTSAPSRTRTSRIRPATFGATCASRSGSGEIVPVS